MYFPPEHLIKPYLRVLVLFLLLLPIQAVAQVTVSTLNNSLPDRPKIGLVLAGGGAKGGAHVGVLKILEEMRIPIDYIAGTSMGSIVGGLYASGLTPEEIEAAIDEIDWVDIFDDEPRREDRSFRRKTDDRLYLFDMKPGFNDGEVEIPLAFIHGQKLDLALNRLTQRVSGIDNFDDLPIPYRAVATDIETGQQVVLKSGSLPISIRASMAVPGAFDPVEIDDKLLIDGGISNNIPVNVARSMGADVLIVSDLGSHMLKRKDIKSAIAVAGQMVNFLFSINSQEALKTLTPKDVLISNELGDIGSGSFDRISETIPIGVKAAKNAAQSLKRYALDEKNFKKHLASRWQPKNEAPVIDYVRVENLSGIGDDVISSRITLKPGEPLDVDKLENDIQQLYGLDIFQSVRYDLEEQEDKTGVIITAVPKAWGPGYLQTGMIASSNPDGDVAFRFGMAYTGTELNSLNGEWRLGGQVGDEPGIFAEIYQPLDAEGRFFTSGLISYFVEKNNIFDDSGNKLKEIRSDGYKVDLGVGREFGNWGQLRLGYLYASGTTEVKVGTPAPDTDFDIGQLSLRLTSDKLNSLFFPTTGYAGKLEYVVSREDFGSDSDYEQLTVNYLQAQSWGRNTLIGGVNLSSTIHGTAPDESLYKLGGFLNLSGFEQGQLTGQHSGHALAVYMRRINDISFFQAYAGASLEAGNVWQDSDDIAWDDTIVAGSVFIGADTPIGPLYLSLGHNDTGESSLSLFLGPLFSF